jgi:nucleotide-binding universal stress UspA family protein
MMNILFATDGSEGARTAGRLLAALRLPAEARVTVLTAAPNGAWVQPPGARDQSATDARLDTLSIDPGEMAHRTAEIAAASLREHGIETGVCVRRQSPVNAILEKAQEEKAELIVVGAHGMSRIERFLIGSVSERVARYAHCSVLVARTDTVRCAIIAVDGSESSEHALDAFVRLRLPAEVELTVVYVVRPVEVIPTLPAVPPLNFAAVARRYDEECRKAGGRILDHALERLNEAGRAATRDLRCGSPADELISAAHQIKADLIVVGAANRSSLGRLFLGSVSGRVLSHAPCSALVARLEA